VTDDLRLDFRAAFEDIGSFDQRGRHDADRDLARADDCRRCVAAAERAASPGRLKSFDGAPADRQGHPSGRISLSGYLVSRTLPKGKLVNRIVYLVGAIVIIIALLSFFGLR